MYLIVGSDGVIGSALSKSLTLQRLPHLDTSRRAGATKIHLDLETDPAAWQLPKGIDTAFLCAGKTTLKDCEENQRQTALVNVERTVELGKRLLAQGAFLIFLSSSLVFDGSRPFRRPDDPCAPTTQYGFQKMCAERELLGLSSRVAVSRLTKVVHPGMPLFRRWQESISKSEIINPYHDMLFSPIPLCFVILALERIAAKKLAGIAHLSGDRDISYADFAREVAKLGGAHESLVRPIHAPSSRKGFSSLDMTLTARDLCLEVPSIRAGIESLYHPDFGNRGPRFSEGGSTRNIPEI